jgi:hypothetical protein
MSQFAKVLIWFPAQKIPVDVPKFPVGAQNSLPGGENFPAADTAILKESNRFQWLVRDFGAPDRDFSLRAGNLPRRPACL